MISLFSSVLPQNLLRALVVLFSFQISSLHCSIRVKRESEENSVTAPHVRRVQPNIMTVCSASGERYTVDTNSCKKGAWLPEGLEVTCICVDGLWAISENFCDRDFLLLAGKNQECFEISGPVKRFVSLFNPTDPADKGKKIILRSNLETIDTFSHSLHTKHNENGSYIIRFDDTRHEMYLRHTEGYQENFWQRCIEASRKPEKFQIIQANGVTFADGKRGCRESQDLEYPMKKVKGSTWGFSLGQSWSPLDGVGRKSVKCFETCFEKDLRKRQISSGEGDLFEDSLEAALMNDIENRPGRDVNDTLREGTDTGTKADTNTGNVNKKGTSDEVIDPATERYQKIDRDTSKIAYYLKNWNMKKEPGPKLPYKEYKYLQYARIILLKTCPSEFVPVGALTDFLRLFRYLVYESLKKAPEHYSEDINKSADKRIIASLESCYASAQPMEFSLANGCPNKVESVTYNGKSIPSTLPSHLIVNQNQTDLILETMWKMVLVTHYLCSENFVRNGGDLSTMYMKLQEFLTDPHIMFRWENPGYSSNQVYRILFPSLDFPKLITGINACVAAAHGVSKYTKWLKRPSSNVQKTARIMARKMTKLSARGRSLNSLPTLFNKQGYCTNAYDDPLRWSKYNPDIKAVCDPRF